MELVFDGINFTLTKENDIFTKIFKVVISDKLKEKLEYLYNIKNDIKDYIITPIELLYEDDKLIGYSFQHSDLIQEEEYLLDTSVTPLDKLELLNKIGNNYYQLMEKNITIDNPLIEIFNKNPIFANLESCEINALDKISKYFMKQMSLFFEVLQIYTNVSYKQFNFELSTKFLNDLKPLIPEWFYNILNVAVQSADLFNYEFKNYYEKIKRSFNYETIHNSKKWEYYNTKEIKSTLTDDQLFKPKDNFITIDNRTLFIDFIDNNIVITNKYNYDIASITEKITHLINIKDILKEFYNTPTNIVSEGGKFAGFKTKYNRLQHQGCIELFFDSSNSSECDFSFRNFDLASQLGLDMSTVFPLFVKLGNSIQLLNSCGIIHTNINSKLIFAENETILIDDLGQSKILDYGDFIYSEDVNSFYDNKIAHKNVDRAMVFVYFIEYITSVQFYKIMSADKYGNFIKLLQDFVPEGVLELFNSVINFNVEFTAYFQDYEDILKTIDEKKMDEFYTFFLEHSKDL
jgi:hypothetical protein